MTHMVLVPVEWHIPPSDDMDMPSYRTCDICYESATVDVLAGKHIEEFRTFVKVQGGNDDGLTVCEHCLDAFLKESS